MVDDGSTDNSGRICDGFAEKDTRIRVFHKENEGVSSARNLGLDNARGEWIYFADSDDELLPGGLESLVDKIHAEGNADIIMGGYEKYDEKGLLISRTESFPTTFLPKRESLSSLYQFHTPTNDYLGYLWLRLLRNQIIQKNNLRFDPLITIKEDTLFITQYICHSNGITVVDLTPVYKYKWRSDSAMGGWRKGFDYNYVTSFYALQRMKQEISRTFPPYSDIVYIAKEGLWIRYNWIKEKLEKLGIEDRTLLSSLQRELRKEKVGFCFKVQKKVRKISKRFKKSI